MVFACANASCNVHTTQPQALKDTSKWRTIGSFWPGDWEKPVDGATHTCINCYKQKLRLQREAEEARSSRSKSVPPVEHHKPPLSEVEGLAQNPARRIVHPAPGGNPGIESRPTHFSCGGLDDQLFRQNMVRRSVGAFGACMFASASVLAHGSQAHAQLVRDTVCDYLLRNEEEFAPFIDDQDQNYGDYIARMRREGTEGGQMELIILTRIYRRPIQIIEPVPGGYIVRTVLGEEHSANGTMVIAYVPPPDSETGVLGHYDPISRLNEEPFLLVQESGAEEARVLSELYSSTDPKAAAATTAATTTVTTATAAAATTAAEAQRQQAEASASVQVVEMEEELNEEETEDEDEDEEGGVVIAAAASVGRGQRLHDREARKTTATSVSGGGQTRAEETDAAGSDTEYSSDDAAPVPGRSHKPPWTLPKPPSDAARDAAVRKYLREHGLEKKKYQRGPAFLAETTEAANTMLKLLPQVLNELFELKGKYAQQEKAEAALNDSGRPPLHELLTAAILNPHAPPSGHCCWQEHNTAFRNM